MKSYYLRIVLAGVLGLIGWGISNAQTITCRSIGSDYVTCTSAPPPPATAVPSPSSPSFDPSVIREIPDGLRIDPAMLQLILLQHCIQRQIQAGFTYPDARKRCL